MVHCNVTVGVLCLCSYLEHGKDNGTSEILDVCSITLDKSPCGVRMMIDVFEKSERVECLGLNIHGHFFLVCHQLTDAVENVAHVLHCAARANLTMSEETSMRLIVELTERLNSLLMELSTTVRTPSVIHPVFSPFH